MVDFLIIIAVMLAVVALIVGVVYAFSAVNSRRKYGLSLRKSSGYSWPALQIFKEYKALPAANRPYANLEYMLTALDVKYGRGEITEHFTQRGYEYFSSSWDCRHVGDCAGTEYKDLRNSIVGISRALKAQEHALATAAVQDGLSSVQELTDRLREEKNLINQVTKELT